MQMANYLGDGAGSSWRLTTGSLLNDSLVSWRNLDILTEATLDASLELEARRRAAARATAESSELLLLVVDIFPTSSRSRSSSLIKRRKRWQLVSSKTCIYKNYLETNLIRSMMYLSGTRPSRPSFVPFHQSLDTWLYSESTSPFLKLSSRCDRAVKSNCAVASSVSDSVNNKLNH